MTNDLRKKILDPQIFKRPLNWDWSKQRWRGCYLKNDSTTCNYFDLSDLSTKSSKYYYNKPEFSQLLLEACSADCKNFKRAFCASPVSIRYGDIIQTGKTKNRDMFVMGHHCLIPITQVLGGNGYGEIPLSFILSRNQGLSPHSKTLPSLPPSYWTIHNHPLINLVPVSHEEDSTNISGSPNGKSCSAVCQSLQNANTNKIVRLGTSSIFLDESVYSVCDGTQWSHPYFYVDQSSKEFFSLPKTVLSLFGDAEQQVRNRLIDRSKKKPLKNPQPVITSLKKKTPLIKIIPYIKPKKDETPINVP